MRRSRPAPPGLPEGAPTPSALSMLERLQIQERLEARRQAKAMEPSLVTLLMPLWIWGLGVSYLPDAFPMFARVMFHASCWGGFAWTAVQAWRKRAGKSPEKQARQRRILEEDIEKARRRRALRDAAD